jgi:hypothetical protein
MVISSGAGGVYIPQYTNTANSVSMSENIIGWYQSEMVS